MTTEIQAPPAPDATPAEPGTPDAAPSPDPPAAASAGPAARGKLRRRLRRLMRIRDRQRVELGTLVVDARKHSNGSRPEVLERRAAEAAEVDRQVRELSHAVDTDADAREVVAGIAGSCANCGSILATDDRFCPACGTPTKPGRARPAAEPEPAAAAVKPPPVPMPEAPTAEQPAAPAEAPAAPAATPAAPPPPPEGASLAHADRAAIPPPPPPPASS